MKILVLLIASLSLSLDAWADDEKEVLACMAGASVDIDGIMAESTFKDKSRTGSWLGRCIARYDFEQLKAIFEKELNNNPESWHVPAALILKKR